MDRGGEQLLEGMEDMVLADEDIGTWRGKHTGVGDNFKGGGTDSSSLWVGDVGYDPCMGQVLVGFHHRKLTDNRMETTVVSRR